MRTRWLTPQPAAYVPVWEAMQTFTHARTDDTPDEIWLTEHTPVYTLGQAGKTEHLLDTGDIPVVHTDRGGQVTYHGPGQVVAYVLFDLRRGGYFVKAYVHRLEAAVIDTLETLGVSGARREPGAPGVYVPIGLPGEAGAAKIAALGVKIRNGRAYHGVALNVAMDLSPFDGINPCGYARLRTTDLASTGTICTLAQAGDLLAARIAERLSPS